MGALTALVRSRALVLALVVAAALLARVAAAVFDVPIHIDENFQYLEPARWHLHGAGFQAWEFTDGARSWVLPGYHGAWLAAFEAVGASDGATLHLLLRLHWACAALLLVWAAWHGGAGPTDRLTRWPRPRPRDDRTDWRGGLIAAGLCAAFPFLVRLAPRTLTENPSMIALVAALVLTGKLVNEASLSARWHPPWQDGRAWAVGVLLGLGCCLRITNGPAALAVPLWLLVAGRGRALLPVALGAAAVVTLFGLVDRLTWGSWFGSFAAYVRFNFIEGKAARYGVEPPSWYLLQLWQELGLGGPALLALALLRWRATWPYLLAAALLLASLSTQAHKEPRFIALVYPLLFIAVGRSAGQLLPSFPSEWSANKTALALLAAGALGGAFAQARLGRCHPGRDCWAHDVQSAQAWAARQPTLAGLLVEQPWLTAGHFYLPPHVPLASYDKALLTNPLFDHLLAKAGSQADTEARAAGFAEIYRRAGQVVLRRSR
jgi:GPI mannosyltransferase 3